MVAMNSKYWLYLFFADLLIELTAITLHRNDIHQFAKPFLIAILFVWFMASSVKFSPLRYRIAAALFFSWLGDVFLLMEEKNPAWFMAGLVSFLLAHILYILFFLKIRSMQATKQSWNLLIIVIVEGYAASLFILLYPHIGSLQIPVAVYAITIATMLVTAAHAFNKNMQQAARYCITGAALFVTSDSLLALNKFYHPFAAAALYIMLTYGLAQFAITKGSLLYLAGENTV